MDSMQRRSKKSQLVTHWASPFYAGPFRIFLNRGKHRAAVRDTNLKPHTGTQEKSVFSLPRNASTPGKRGNRRVDFGTAELAGFPTNRALDPISPFSLSSSLR